ncbi:MAG: insulinase family protein [Acidobacteriota bacterium]|nr:MAG: insulinase family protein [Acidobacteriota bacterium]
MKINRSESIRLAGLLAVVLLLGGMRIEAPAQAGSRATTRAEAGKPARLERKLAVPEQDASTSGFVTANGLRTIHRQVLGNDVVAVQIYFRGGTRNISEKNAGIETLLFEVAQQGTRNFSKGQINRELASMGTVLDSAGGYDYSVIAMRCVRQNFDRSWQILSDIVLNPVFDEKEVALARDQIVNGLRQQNDSPDSYVALLSNKLLFKSHPYFNSPAGTVESMSALTAVDLKAHHTKILSTGRMLVVVVGHVAPADVRRKVESSFGKLAKGEYRSETMPAFAESNRPEFEIVEKPVATNYIRGTFAAPPLNHPDYPAFSVTMNILQQLFFQEVRVKRNLSYGADATLLSNDANSAYISVTTPKPNETLRVMFDQIDFLQRQIILERPLKAIVSGFLTQYYTKLETNDAQAARLAEYELLGGGWNRLQTWISEVDRVTPEDIQRVSRTYLKNFHFAAIGDPRLFDRDLFVSR